MRYPDAVISHRGRRLIWLGRMAQLGAAAAGLAYVPHGYTDAHLEFRSDRLVLWRSTQADVQKFVTDWAIANLPRNSRLIIDMSMWLNLHDIPSQRKVFNDAHYYWKVMEDPEIRDTLLHRDWRNVDYVITTNQMNGATNQMQDKLIFEALRHSILIAAFDTGGWPVEVRQVHHPCSITRRAQQDRSGTGAEGKQLILR